MRSYAIFLILFTFVMLSTPPATESATESATETAVDANELSTGTVRGLSRTDLWVLRLASDFTIVQSRIADMMVRDELGGWAKDHLLRIDKALREDVMTVVGAAAAGDHDAVRVLLPTVARQLRRQILILIEDDGVARQWVAARGKTLEMVTRNTLSAPEVLRIALARIE